MVDFKVRVQSHNLETRILTVTKGAEEAAQTAIFAAMQLAFRQSQREVPVKTGVLKNSGQLKDPEVLSPGVVRVAITYGGSASAYAQVQHDNVTLNHPGGGKAHFVIDPVRDAVPEMKNRLKKALAALGGK